MQVKKGLLREMKMYIGKNCGIKSISKRVKAVWVAEL